MQTTPPRLMRAIKLRPIEPIGGSDVYALFFGYDYYQDLNPCVEYTDLILRNMSKLVRTRKPRMRRLLDIACGGDDDDNSPIHTQPQQQPNCFSDEFYEGLSGALGEMCRDAPGMFGDTSKLYEMATVALCDKTCIVVEL